jgi:hypothetical protein
MVPLIILATFNFKNFPVLNIFNLGYFQATILNGSKEEEEQQEHIDCVDLAIKNCCTPNFQTFRFESCTAFFKTFLAIFTLDRF